MPFSPKGARRVHVSGWVHEEWVEFLISSRSVIFRIVRCLDVKTQYTLASDPDSSCEVPATDGRWLKKLHL
jgi:hypothetical protein